MPDVYMNTHCWQAGGLRSQEACPTRGGCLTCGPQRAGIIPGLITPTERNAMANKDSNIFVQVLKEYMVETSLHGYQYLVTPGRHIFERIIWMAIHIVATTGLLIIVYGMYRDYFNQYPVTTIKSMYHPIKNVTYPGIAICDINKLRKSKTLALASTLHGEYNVSVTEERLGELLRYLGMLYDQSEQINSEAVLREFDAILTAANITLNITDVMRKLSTPCDELLITCLWKGQRKQCKDIFQTRKTMEGYCCTFNYVRPTDNFNATLLTTSSGREPQTVPNSGPEMGLTVLLRSNLSDYYYPSIPVYGLKVLVFNPYDYPDTGSGGLTELLVPMKEEVFFSVSAVSTIATDQVDGIDLHRRSCYFTRDIKEKYGELYSYSDCMMDCRINFIREKCGCLPFYWPSRVETPVCGIENVHCLLINRDFWQTLRPHSLLAEENKAGANFCPSPCYPTCTSTLYMVQTSSLPLNYEQIAKSSIYPKIDIENHSMVHIFFGSPNTSLMLTDVLVTWFELLSNIGGVCGAFVGFSLMSIIEFIYFFTVRLAFEACERRRQKAVADIDGNVRNNSVTLEKGTANAITRQKNTLADIFYKRTDLRGRKENKRRNLARTTSVQIFWNEISLPRNWNRELNNAFY